MASALTSSAPRRDFGRRLAAVKSADMSSDGRHEVAAQGALTRFCTVYQSLKNVDASETAVLQKQTREACNALKGLVKDDMVSHGLTCCPVYCDGEQWYSRLKARRKPVKLDVATLIGAVESMTAADVAAERLALPDKTLPELIASWLKRTLKGDATGGTVTVELTRTPERSFVHPTQRHAQVEDHCAALHAETKKLRAAQLKLKELRAPLKSEQARIEKDVASQLTELNPSEGSQRVRVQESSGVSNEYIVKRHTVARTKRPAAKMVLPAVRRALEQLCTSLQIVHDASIDGLQCLQQRHNMTVLEKRFEEALARITQSQEEVQVRMHRLRASRR